MRDVRLVRHPLPKPTESLQGYLLRLVEANGHSTIGRTFAFAGLTQSDLAWTNLDIAKLAAPIGCPVEVLEAIAYKHRSDDDRTFRLLGQEVQLQDLSLSKAKVCPECVDELGYIEATWNLTLFVGCPVHKRTCFYFCGTCKKTVAGDRKGMLVCRCEAPMRNTPLQELSPHAVALLDLIRFKLTGQRVSEKAGFSFIERELIELPLDWMLSRIRSLGKARLTANWVSESRFYPRDLLHAAASVVGDWPVGYQRLVRDFDRNFRAPSDVPVPQSLDHLYQAIMTAKEARYGRAPGMGL